MFFAYTGRADAMIRFVQDKQLKDPQLWQLAAEQFTAPVDDADLGWRGEYWGKLMRGAVHDVGIYAGGGAVSAAGGHGGCAAGLSG